MGPGDEEVDTVCLPYFRRYKSGRVERLSGTAVVPSSLDPTTGVASKDVAIAPVSARLYLRPFQSDSGKLPVLVYYHGGGFCIGSAFSATYHPFLNSLAAAARVLIVSVDYRLAPEHPLPAAYQDSLAALDWVFSPSADDWITQRGDLARVFLAGDSSGANIAHQMAMCASRGRVTGIILIHPHLWGSEPLEGDTASPEQRAWLDRLWKLVTSPEMSDLDDPRINPIAAEGPAGLAGLGCERVLICVAEKDVMTARGRAYYEALKASGWQGEAELFVSEGEEHVFHLDQPESETAAELVRKIAGFVNKDV